MSRYPHRGVIVSIGIIVLGGAMLAVVFYDALSTTLVTTTAAGPVTARVAMGLWWLARRAARGPGSALMGLAGPVILLATVGLWLVLLWGGWTLIFAAGSEAVVSSTSGQAADVWARIYFAASTTFSLGIGDYVPNGAPWEVLTSIAVISGLGLTTMAITYLVPVVTAVTARRTQANLIAALGRTPQDIVIAGWRQRSFRFLDEQLPRLAEGITLTAERHLSYPVLHFYQTTEQDEDFRIQLFHLDEAVTILQHAIPERWRPHPAALASVRHATAELLRHVPLGDPGERQPVCPGLEALHGADIPTIDAADFAKRLKVVEDHRRRLTAFAGESLWYQSRTGVPPDGG